MNKNTTLGELVAQYPKSAKLFEQHKIDYCCNGHRKVDEALRDHADKESIMNELTIIMDTSTDTNTDWTKTDLQALVNHILNTHHAYLYKTLPTLSELTTMIYRVHGQNHPELQVIHRTFHELKMELESHLIKEETIQYPAIETYLTSKNNDALKQAQTVIQELEVEHEVAGNALKRLRELSCDYAIPEAVCGTYERTYALLEALEKDMFKHIHLENNILFKRLLAL